MIEIAIAFYTIPSLKQVRAKSLAGGWEWRSPGNNSPGNKEKATSLSDSFLCSATAADWSSLEITALLPSNRYITGPIPTARATSGWSDNVAELKFVD